MIPPSQIGAALGAQYRFAGQNAANEKKKAQIDATLRQKGLAGIWDDKGNFVGARPLTKEELPLQSQAGLGKTAAETGKLEAETKAIPLKIAMQGEKINTEKELAYAKIAAQKDIAAMRIQAANDPNKLTMATRNIKQLAVSLLPEIDRVDKETDAVRDLLGPGAGRWNNFWQGKVGISDPKYASYKDDVGFLSTGITLAHARGRMSNELFEHFMQMFDAGKQSPENMKAAISVARTWMQNYASLGEPGAPLGPPAKKGGGSYSPNNPFAK
jgi:hypothetical protein